jgi:ligand-binding sensor domain-containing protein
VTHRSAAARGWLRLASRIVGLGWLAASPALALDPHRSVSQYSIRNWRGGAGFPQDATVQAITQTPDGYLWLGTMEGLLRFDGVRTTRFAGHKDKLPHDNVWGLRVDGTGRVWAGTDGGGVFVWQNGVGVTQTFDANTGLNTNAIRPIIQARDGSMWVGTNRSGINRYKDGRWTYITMKNGLLADQVWAMAEASDGSIWVGAGGVNRCVEDKCASVRTQQQGLPGGGITAMTFARNGDLWVGMWAGVSRLHDGTWKDWKVTDGLPGGTVRAIHEDRDGNVWVGTSEGLVRFQGDQFEALGKDQGAVSGYVRALFEDKEGTLWVGSVSAGLAALSDGQFLNVGDREGLPHHNVRAVQATSDGSFWAGAGANTGLTHWKDGTVEIVRNLPTNTVRCFTIDPRDERSFWIGVDDRVVHWRTDRGVIAEYGRKPGYALVSASMLVDAKGGVWVATTDGLGELRDGAWRVYTTKDGLPHNGVFSLANSRDGGVWAGTSGGLAKWRDGQWTTAVEKVAGTAPRLSIYSIHEDADGVLWTGTNNGLWRLENGEWTSFDIAHGFCADTVDYVTEDDLGFLWAASPKGLCRVNREALNSVAHRRSSAINWRLYDRSDGIRDTGFTVGNAPKGGRLPDGRLYFATNGGIVITDPKRLHVESAPPITIEALTADNVSVPLGAPIALGPGRPRLEFRFTGLTFVAPEKLRFRYRLEPFDPGWIDAGEQRVAYYTNLPPAAYTFRVSGVNSDGVWNDTGTPLAFRVKPYAWETWWFRTLAALSLAAVGLLAYRWRVRRMHALARELERRVKEALQDIHTLKGLLPICASCKKIRDDGGYWNQIETYVSNHSSAEFSHSICPDCLVKLYPDYAKDVRNRNQPG